MAFGSLQLLLLNKRNLVTSCIIPFYNESQRLSPIVDVVASFELIDEVILVDDGSTDGGFDFVSPKVVQHRFPRNKGKSEAMRYGFNHSRGDVIIFIDADLHGLTHSHISQLLEPLLTGHADITVSEREHISFFNVVSGERALMKNTWTDFFNTSACHRNAMEIAMNSYALSHGLTIRWIPWAGVSQTYKSQKGSFFSGVSKDVRNVIDWIFQLGIFPFGCTYLLSWFMIINEKGWMTIRYRNLYEKMYRV